MQPENHRTLCAVYLNFFDRLEDIRKLLKNMAGTTRLEGIREAGEQTEPLTTEWQSDFCMLTA